MGRLKWKLILQGCLVNSILLLMNTSGWAQSVASFNFTDDRGGQTQKALTAYRQGLDKHRQGKDLEAADSLQQAVKLDPRFSEAYNTLCVVYDELKRPDDAIKTCEQAIALKSDFAIAFYNLGLIYDTVNRGAEAITALEKVVALNPTFAEAHYSLGQLYDKQGRFELAQASLKRAIQLKPEFAAAYGELGFSFCHLGRIDEAIAVFQRAVTLAPGEAQFHGNLGTAYYLAGQHADAIASLNRAIMLKPDLQVALNNLGEVYLKTSQYSEAIHWFRRALDVGNDRSEFQPGIYNDLAAAYAHRAEYKQATKLLAKAIHLKPDFSTAIFNLGVVSVMMNDKEGAYHQYVALKPLDRELATKLYARLYSSRLVDVR